MLVNAVVVSFNTATGKMTETSLRKKETQIPDQATLSPTTMCQIENRRPSRTFDHRILRPGLVPGGFRVERDHNEQALQDRPVQLRDGQ